MRPEDEKKTIKNPQFGLNNVFRYKEVAADYMIRPEDFFIGGDSTGGNINVNLLPAKIKGQMVSIKKIDNSVNSVVVNRHGADTIEGNTSVTLNAQYESVTLVSNGVNKWHIVSTT